MERRQRAYRASAAAVPVFGVVLFEDGGHDAGWRIAAWGVFAIASITDRFDGEIARRRGLITEFGKLADPIADKALIGTALVGLSILGELPWWVTIVILVREVGVTALRFWVIRLGVIEASRGGKLKTLLQGVAIGWYVLPLHGWLHDSACDHGRGRRGRAGHRRRLCGAGAAVAPPRPGHRLTLVGMRWAGWRVTFAIS